MGWQFHRRVRVCPGVRLNVCRTGASVSFGRRGAWLTLSRHGRRVTVGAPGTGVFYTSYQPHNTNHGSYLQIVGWCAAGVLAYLFFIFVLI